MWTLATPHFPPNRTMVGRGFVFFPLIIHAFDLLVSSVGSLAVRLRKPSPQASQMDVPMACSSIDGSRLCLGFCQYKIERMASYISLRNIFLTKYEHLWAHDAYIWLRAFLPINVEWLKWTARVQAHHSRFILYLNSTVATNNWSYICWMLKYATRNTVLPDSDAWFYSGRPLLIFHIWSHLQVCTVWKIAERPSLHWVHYHLAWSSRANFTDIIYIRIFLSTDQAPEAWWHFYVCGIIGMVGWPLVHMC